jgi:hypothetical protein
MNEPENLDGLGEHALPGFYGIGIGVIVVVVLVALAITFGLFFQN